MKCLKSLDIIYEMSKILMVIKFDIKLKSFSSHVKRKKLNLL